MKQEEIVRIEPPLKLINMESVEVEQIEWLFYPFIPYGKVTIIQGDPGEGKTTMVLQIIAKLTRGEPILPIQLIQEKEQKNCKENSKDDNEAVDTDLQKNVAKQHVEPPVCLLYTSPSPRDS